MRYFLNCVGHGLSVNFKASVIACCLLLALGTTFLSAQADTVPKGWMLAGDHPQNYTTGVDKGAVHLGHPSAYLKSKPSATEGFGTLMQQFDAAPYLGKRIRLTAWIKSEGVDDWAGLWMRIDNGTKAVALDNMQDRPIKGTSEWRNYTLVLDVPKAATGIFFGVLLSKTGTVWLNSVQFETVGIDVPVTNMWTAGAPPQLPSAPTNLNFEDQ